MVTFAELSVWVKMPGREDETVNILHGMKLDQQHDVLQPDGQTLLMLPE